MFVCVLHAHYLLVFIVGCGTEHSQRETKPGWKCYRRHRSSCRYTHYTTSHQRNYIITHRTVVGGKSTNDSTQDSNEVTMTLL